LTVQLKSFESYVSSSTRPFDGYRWSQAATVGFASNAVRTRCFVRCADAGAGANGVWTSLPLLSKTGPVGVVVAAPAAGASARVQTRPARRRRVTVG